jgi:hypothetical protein
VKKKEAGLQLWLPTVLSGGVCKGLTSITRTKDSSLHTDPGASHLSWTRLGLRVQHGRGGGLPQRLW